MTSPKVLVVWSVLLAALMPAHEASSEHCRPPMYIHSGYSQLLHFQFGQTGCILSIEQHVVDGRIIIPRSDFVYVQYNRPRGSATSLSGTLVGLGLNESITLTGQVVNGVYVYRSPIIPINPSASGCLVATVAIGSGTEQTSFHTLDSSCPDFP